ncbi:MAG: alpha-D-ribose 1-methylphosphonate 5-triphosphate diphosphatase [Thermodesulfobacteriota bacterium]
MRGDFIVRNARLSTPSGILEGMSMRVEDGRIAGIRAGELRGPREINAGGNLLLPGFVDIHSDAIEKGIEPRPNTFFPVDVAVHELDKKIAGCGVTTVYHSLSFAEMEVGLRSNGMAAGIVRQVNGLSGCLRVRTKVHVRFEVTDGGAVPVLERLIRDGQVHLFSFMDHSPGQGQFRDIGAFKRYYGPVYRKSDREMDDIIARKLEARGNGWERELKRLVGLCGERGIAVASHDDDSPEKIAWLKGLGVGLTEFPVNLPAAAAARELGIRVCLGSPNVVRGGSQAKNLDAREAIRLGCGDILCSDYSPMTLLHAVTALTRLGILPLHEAVEMASLHPARAVGIDAFTGSLEEGKDADLLIVDDEGAVPRILKTFVRGREVFSSC